MVFQCLSIAALPLEEPFNQVPAALPADGQLPAAGGQIPPGGVDTDDRHLLGLLLGHRPLGGLGGGLGGLHGLGGLGGGLNGLGGGLNGFGGGLGGGLGPLGFLG